MAAAGATCPPGRRPRSAVAWHLRPGGGLDPDPPAGDGPPAAFRYDPRDPTPSLGGPLLVAQRAGVYDNRPLEARADVLTFTGPPLEAPYEIAGPVRAGVYVRGELPYFDVFARLCDVDPRGRSWNVCDALVRVVPGRFPVDAAGVTSVEVPMWPAAHVFRAGHRIRLQLSGGAHPRYARNPGTGEPLTTAVDLRAGRIEVFCSARWPSAVHLPTLLHH